MLEKILKSRRKKDCFSTPALYIRKPLLFCESIVMSKIIKKGLIFTIYAINNVNVIMLL